MQGRDTQIMALSVQFVGIDVSKAWLDVWFEGTKRDERFSNEEAGWTALLVRLTAAGETAGVRIAPEASGGYERGFREAPLAARGGGYFLNPPRVPLYAPRPRGNAKNDKNDAPTNAPHAPTPQPPPQTPHPA